MASVLNTKNGQKEEKQVYIDINCDLAQSYGVYRNEPEFELLPYVSSVNISCGLHAGDPAAITRALKIAKEYNLSVGAHVGYPDIQGFGYRSMNLDDDEMISLITYQIGALTSLAKLHNIEIDHVRPHGALYKQAATDFNVSASLAKAIAKYNPWLVYVGAVSENLVRAGEAANIKVASEVLLDKKYNYDGSMNFDEGNVADMEYSSSLLESLIKASAVKNINDGYTKIEFNTIHLDIKNDLSLQLAKKVREMVKNLAPVRVSVIKDTGWLQ